MHVFARVREAIMVRMGIKLSPGRMEEICSAIEDHLRGKGGIVYGSAPSKGRPSGAMIWRFPELEGISAREMGMFRTGITPNMEERLKKAQQPTIDVRKARRTANLARAKERLAAVGQVTA